jgi:hypothetical protein
MVRIEKFMNPFDTKVKLFESLIAISITKLIYSRVKPVVDVTFKSGTLDFHPSLGTDTTRIQSDDSLSLHFSFFQMRFQRISAPMLAQRSHGPTERCRRRVIRTTEW